MFCRGCGFHLPLKISIRGEGGRGWGGLGTPVHGVEEQQHPVRHALAAVSKRPSDNPENTEYVT